MGLFPSRDDYIFEQTCCYLKVLNTGTEYRYYLPLYHLDGHRGACRAWKTVIRTSVDLRESVWRLPQLGEDVLL